MDDNILWQANQVIIKAANDFLKRINEISDYGPYKKYRKLSSTFSMLKLGNKAFYEYAYFERTLEWYVRDYLVNQILRELFTIHGIETRWPDNKNNALFDTESIENVAPFEFIFIVDDHKIGVRYTGLDCKEATRLKKEYDVEEILQIAWNDESTGQRRKAEEYELVEPAVFFGRYFSAEEYTLFLGKAISAVELANVEIGFETIPRLSLRYLSDFKVEVGLFLQKNAFRQMTFQELKSSKELKRPIAELFSDEDIAILNENFQQRGLYKALLGNEGFAKCFITAEYQYHVFGQGQNFDYTAIACGYFKAVEQLIYKLLLINLDYPSNDELWIKSSGTIPPSMKNQDSGVRQNPANRKSLQVLFKQDYKPFFDITLTPMIWFLHDNKNGWNISDNGRLKAHEYFKYFASNCRNDHMHKDNINEFETVSRIRNDAIIIMYLLLGGYKLTGNHQYDLTVLGATDDLFDQTYKKIRNLPRSICKFIICYDGKASFKAYRCFEQEPTVYDMDGSVAHSRIKFVLVEKFDSNEYDKAMSGAYPAREFYFQKGNMPQKISFINGKNEEISILG